MICSEDIPILIIEKIIKYSIYSLGLGVALCSTFWKTEIWL